MPSESIRPPVHLDPATLDEVARIMRLTIGEEIPTGPAQKGAFSATLTWATWCEEQAVKKRAAL